MLIHSSIVERGIRRLGDTGTSVLEYNTPLLIEEEPADQVATTSGNGTDTNTTPRKNYGATTKSQTR